MNEAEPAARFFKTAWFAKAAHKARIDDTELGEASIAKSYASLNEGQIARLLKDKDLMELMCGAETEV